MNQEQIDRIRSFVLAFRTYLDSDSAVADRDEQQTRQEGPDSHAGGLMGPIPRSGSDPTTDWRCHSYGAWNRVSPSWRGEP